MRSCIGILFLLSSACDDSSTRETVENPADKVRTLDDLSNYQDFDAEMSSDGQRAVFISRRDSGSYRTYLYDETAQPKIKAYAERRPLEAGEAELSVVLSRDGEWLVLERKGDSTHRLVLSRWDGQVFRELSLPANAQISGLDIYGGVPSPFFVFASKVGTQTKIQVYAFDAATAEMSQIGQFDGESRPLLTSGPQGQLVLYSLAQSNFAWRARAFDSASSTWSDVGSPMELSHKKDQSAAAAASPRGLVFASSLTKPKLKPKLGSNSERPEGYVPDVGVLDRLTQLDPFNLGSANLLDFEAANYRPFQPLAVSSLSLSDDGAYALITGTDTYFCKSRQIPLSFFQLVRTSDMITIPLFVARTPSTDNPSWSQLLTDVCAVYDAEAPSLEVDGAVARASLEGSSGSQFRLTYESQQGGEREVYRASFAVDNWTDRQVSGITITNLSENRRP